MTETQRAAMQQALEAIEADIATYTDQITLRRDEAQRVLSTIDWINRYGVVDKYAPSLHQAEIALRAALAEPEPEPEQEPIWQTLAKIGESAPAGTWDAPVGPPASPSLTPAQEHADELLDALKALLHDPTGCAFCDSGKPRKYVLTGELCEHDEQCGFVKARAAIKMVEEARPCA